MKQTIQKLLVVTAMLSAGITAFAFQVDGIYYNILSSSERTVEVTGTDYQSGYDIIIPERIIYNSTTYKVVSIGYHAFYDYDDLTSVTIGNNVKTIGVGAFKNCNSLTSISIGNSVTTIGDLAFTDCDGLTSVTLPNSVTTIGGYAFSDCTGLTSVTIGNNVTTIGGYAFSNCTGLSSVTIPNSVTTIGDAAFSNCKGLIKINSSIDGVLYNKDVSELICYPCGMPLNSFSIPNRVTKIGDAAFSGCSGLTSITIPNSVTTIGDYAFWYCDGLTSVTIPDSVTTIGESAFWYCDGLTSVTIGNSVMTIGGSAFKGCSNIKKIYCQPVIPPSGDIAIFADEALMNATLYVPIGSKEEYEQVDPWRNFWNIEEHYFAGVEDVVGSDVDVTAENGRIIVTGAEDGTRIEVYSVAGQLIYSGTDTTINAPSAGLYIVQVAGEAFKVILQ